MRRRQLLVGAAGAAVLPPAAAEAAPAAPALPAVLQRAALITPLAGGAAMLAAARAGERLLVAGERGIVLYSDDGGERWTQARVPVQVSLTALAFADARHGLACGHFGVLLASADGGASWTLRLDGRRAAELTLAAAADDAQRQAAQRKVAEGADKPWFDIALAGERAFAVGAFGLALQWSGSAAESAASFAQRLPNPRQLHLYAVRAAGDRIYIAGEQGLLLRSTDRGEHFEALASPYKGSFFGLVLGADGSVIAYGLRGHIFRSADGGSRWAQVPNPVPVSLSGGITRDDGRIVLLAQNGDLLSSSDDGRSFVRHAASPPFPAAALVAGKGSRLVLAGLRGVKRHELA